MAEHRPHVIVIEDDPQVRLGIEQALELDDMPVRGFDAAEPALARIGPDFAGTVVCDVRLPGMDGLATLAELKRRLPDVPVVMLSGHGQARNIAVAGFGIAFAQPLLEQMARTVELAHAQGKVDVGEVMTFVAEAERQIQHQQIERHRQHRMHRPQHRMREQRGECCQADKGTPEEDRTAGPAGKGAPCAAIGHPVERCVNPALDRQGPNLFNQQRQYDCEEFHSGRKDGVGTDGNR